MPLTQWCPSVFLPQMIAVFLFILHYFSTQRADGFIRKVRLPMGEKTTSEKGYDSVWVPILSYSLQYLSGKRHQPIEIHTLTKKRPHRGYSFDGFSEMKECRKLLVAKSWNEFRIPEFKLCTNLTLLFFFLLLFSVCSRTFSGKAPG